MSDPRFTRWGSAPTIPIPLYVPMGAPPVEGRRPPTALTHHAYDPGWERRFAEALDHVGLNVTATAIGAKPSSTVTLTSSDELTPEALVEFILDLQERDRPIDAVLVVSDQGHGSHTHVHGLVPRERVDEFTDAWRARFTGHPDLSVRTKDAYDVHGWLDYATGNEGGFPRNRPERILATGVYVGATHVASGRCSTCSTALEAGRRRFCSDRCRTTWNRWRAADEAARCLQGADATPAIVDDDTPPAESPAQVPKLADDIEGALRTLKLARLPIDRTELVDALFAADGAAGADAAYHALLRHLVNA